MICPTGGHLLDEDKFTGGYVFGSHQLHDGMSYRWTFFAGVCICSMSGHVLLRYMI